MPIIEGILVSVAVLTFLGILGLIVYWLVSPIPEVKDTGPVLRGETTRIRPESTGEWTIGAWVRQAGSSWNHVVCTKEWVTPDGWYKEHRKLEAYINKQGNPRREVNMSTCKDERLEVGDVLRGYCRCGGSKWIDLTHQGDGFFTSSVRGMGVDNGVYLCGSHSPVRQAVRYIEEGWFTQKLKENYTGWTRIPKAEYNKSSPVYPRFNSDSPHFVFPKDTYEIDVKEDRFIVKPRPKKSRVKIEYRYKFSRGVPDAHKAYYVLEFRITGLDAPRNCEVQVSEEDRTRLRLVPGVCTSFTHYYSVYRPDICLGLDSIGVWSTGVVLTQERMDKLPVLIKKMEDKLNA